MMYFNENLRNWLLGKSEIDDECAAVPPVDELPQELLAKAQTSNKAELSKINKKLSKMGYEIKMVLSKKESSH